MYTRNISELIKRICIVVAVIVLMAVNMSSNVVKTGYALEIPHDVVSNVVSPAVSFMMKPFLNNNPRAMAEIVVNTVNPIREEFVESIEKKIIISEIMEHEHAEVQAENVEIETVLTESVVVEEVIVEEPVVSEPIVVSIEYPIASLNEISITETYDFSSVPLSEELMQATIDHCDKFGIPIAIALGLMDVESDFITTAGSQSGCYGLMQLNHKYFDVYTEPAQQIHDGLEYLSSNLEKCDGDMMLALNIYNAGHITGNMSYSNKVMNDAAKWSEITGAPMV